MSENIQYFKSLIKQDKYQVFVFSCRAYFPFIFAKHSWVVLNKKGEISRWEIRHYKNKINKNFGYMHLNTQPPFQGVNLSFFIKNHFWKAKLIGFIEGDENSTVKKVIDFIEDSKNQYPYCFKYLFLGPNSNTYTQWILNKFPEFKVKLSWCFIGKRFNIKK